MEPNKMEEDFRKKLNEREIQPSEAAWDRLDAMLSVAEKTAPKRNYRWLYIAASVAIFFTVGLFLFQQEKPNQELEPNNKNTVVTSEETAKAEEDSNTIESHLIPEANQENVVAETSSQTNATPAKKSVLNKAVNFQNPVVREEIVQVISEKTPETQNIGKVEKTEVIAEQSLATITNPKERSKVKVNANSLLSSVEGELNQEFRETTLQKLNRNFKTVKTAVANRNYE